MKDQVVILFKQANTPEQIAEMLGIELSFVLLVLEGRGLLNKKNLNAVLACEDNTAFHIKNTLVKNDGSKKSVQEIYESYQEQVAMQLCELAVTPVDEELPAAVKLKAMIYVNEEASGRNDARAKKNNNGLLLNITDLLQHMKQANSQVNRALGIPENKHFIDIKEEKEAIAV